MAIKWTREEIEKLILCIEQNPCIYEIKSVEYLDRVRKAHVFNNILEELQESNKSLTIAEVKRKWRVLRTQYTQEVRAIEQSKKSGAGSADVYVPKLWCFQQMQFLRTHTQSRQSIDNIQVTTDDDTQSRQSLDNIQATTDDDVQDLSDETPKKRRKISSPSRGIRKDIDKFKTILAERKSEKRYAWLGNLVANQMDLISPERQYDAAWEVQCLMRRLVKQDQNTVPTTTSGQLKNTTSTTTSGKDILQLSMQGLFEDDDFS